MRSKVIKTKTTYDAEKKIWFGIKETPIFSMDSSIGKVVLESLLKDPEHVSQICHKNGNKYTNKEIATLSIRCAQHLRKLGLKQCDVFGIIASNSDYVAPLFFGGMLSGLTVSTLDPSFDKVCLGESTLNGSNGQLAANYKVKIINDNGENLNPGETGEICVKTPFKWAGYYGNAEATKNIYDNDGWIHSGDLGYIDEAGEVFIVGRKKDIMKYDTFHFFPTEIEEVISEMTGVAEVCVCGISDVILSNLPAAAIVKLPGSELTEEEVSEHVSSKMAHFKHLRGGVYFVESIPKTVSGKHVRSSVQNICEKLKSKKKL